MRNKKTTKFLLFVMLLTILFFCSCSGGSGGDGGASVASPESSVVITDAEGLAKFTDSSTKEDVDVYIRDTGEVPLSAINVEFWDANNYELFLVEDPSGEYLPAFKIYPHNSSHWITVYLPEEENGGITELPLESDKGVAMGNFMEDTVGERVYKGRFTPEELDEEDKLRIVILKPVGIGYFLETLSKVADFIEDVTEIIGYEYQEPDFYDVYVLIPSSKITTTIWLMEPVSEENPTCTDADGDGYSIEGGACGEIDCDDDNYDINPGATEICDGIDNNCDGVIDEGCEEEGEITWIYINDPGVPDHEGFTGEMSKHEITNAQYCQYLNDALASGDIRFDDNDLYNDVFGTSGQNGGTDYINRLYYDGNGSSYYTYFPESNHYVHNASTNCGLARINYSNNVFSVDDGFENHPVTLISWYGAVAFCNYYGYRLPTEWEWQAVADYDGTYTYGCGTEINGTKANYGDLTYEEGTTIVGSFGAYGYGMCDMSGNVWEWTSTTINDYLVIRGGGHSSTIDGCTVSERSSGWGAEKSYSTAFGFRVCR